MQRMMIVIDMESETPIYQQLVNNIIEGIAKGALAAGEDLPSVRALAADLGINLHTVNKAYQQLKQEGYIQIHRQKGVVVLPPEARVMDEQGREKMNRELRLIAAQAICKGLDQHEFLAMCARQYHYLKEQGEDRNGK
jgi:GntR family transcriptional regulator